MPKPRRPKRRTRIVIIDGEVFLLLRRRGRVVGLRRLEAFEREMALRMLDDIQAEIEAHVLGANRA